MSRVRRSPAGSGRRGRSGPRPALALDRLLGEPPVPDAAAPGGPASAPASPRWRAASTTTGVAPGAVLAAGGVGRRRARRRRARLAGRRQLPGTAGRGLHDAALDVAGALDAGDLGRPGRCCPPWWAATPPRSTRRPSPGRWSSRWPRTPPTPSSPRPCGPLAAGAVGAFVHRAGDTLDSMVGYRDERYRRFGTPAARLDDALAWVPARATAVLVALARPRRAAAVVPHGAARRPAPPLAQRRRGRGRLRRRPRPAAGRGREPLRRRRRAPAAAGRRARARPGGHPRRRRPVPRRHLAARRPCWPAPAERPWPARGGAARTGDRTTVARRAARRRPGRDPSRRGATAGDGARVAAALGLDPADVLDLSASLNPFAPTCRRWPRRHLGALGRYPDVDAAEALLAAGAGPAPRAAGAHRGRRPGHRPRRRPPRAPAGSTSPTSRSTAATCPGSTRPRRAGGPTRTAPPGCSPAPTRQGRGVGRGVPAPGRRRAGPAARRAGRSAR